jgi:hypothetical protein
MMPTVGPIIGGMLAGMASRAPKPLDYHVGGADYSVLPDCYTEVRIPEGAYNVVRQGNIVIYEMPLHSDERAVPVPPVPWWRRLLRWLLRRGQKRESFAAPRVGDGWDECMEAIRAGERA